MLELKTKAKSFETNYSINYSLLEYLRDNASPKILDAYFRENITTLANTIDPSQSKKIKEDPGFIKNLNELLKKTPPSKTELTKLLAQVGINFTPANYKACKQASHHLLLHDDLKILIGNKKLKSKRGLIGKTNTAKKIIQLNEFFNRNKDKKWDDSTISKFKEYLDAVVTKDQISLNDIKLFLVNLQSPQEDQTEEATSHLHSGGLFAHSHEKKPSPAVQSNDQTAKTPAVGSPKDRRNSR